MRLEASGFGGFRETLRAAAQRDLVRAEILRMVRQANPGGELAALLIAEEQATEEFRQAVQSFQRKGRAMKTERTPGSEIPSQPNIVVRRVERAARKAAKARAALEAERAAVKSTVAKLKISGVA